LHEWLQLDDKGRTGKTPFISTGDGEDEQCYSLSPALARVAAQCLANWQTLQELAGIITPFTAQVEEKIRAEVAAEHQAELDAQKKASDEQIREIHVAASWNSHPGSGTDDDESLPQTAA
jgi:hypothetical protein